MGEREEGHLSAKYVPKVYGGLLRPKLPRIELRCMPVQVPSLPAMKTAGHHGSESECTGEGGLVQKRHK